jgi:hypothetical protein
MFPCLEPYCSVVVRFVNPGPFPLLFGSDFVNYALQVLACGVSDFLQRKGWNKVRIVEKKSVMLFKERRQHRELDVFARGLLRNLYKSNSNSLANQLGIHIILAKQEKLASNSLAKIETWQNSPPHAHIRTRIVVAIIVSL